MLPAPFHEMIETIRRRSGISHDQLSHRAWTSPGYTHRICSGKSKPGRDMVIRLGLALNLSVEVTDEVLRAAGHPGLLDIEPAAPAGQPQPHE
ncbi:MAG: helix-turn-helix transcriptional regulator [Anaerolineales bacterium]|nr:helix-turn-helix transcriptional regulator [Anaerolineales bacterium]